MPKPKPDGDIDNDNDLTEESEHEMRRVKEKKHDSGAADLEKVTDYAEETEIFSSDISGVRGLIEEEVAGRLAKEKELLKVQIKKEDVELIVREMEISQERAERILREHVEIQTTDDEVSSNDNPDDRSSPEYGSSSIADD